MNSSDLMKYFPCVRYVPPTNEAIRTFDGVWDATLKSGEGSVIDYHCPYPKHEFLNYLVEQKGLLLHGSNFTQIKVLIPLRLTTGVSSYGNLEAVYACSDGVWPIYYAIAHRNCPMVSFKTSCFRINESDGTAKKYYYFSLHEEMHKTKPWTEGMVYILGRASFRQLRNHLDQPVEEWASKEPVAVIAKLPVTTQDFPFLNSVLGHRDETSPPKVLPCSNNCDSYVGRYTFSSDLSVDLTRNGDYLFVQFPGYPPTALTPISQDSFRLTPFDLHVAFTNGEYGRPSQLTLQLDGQNWTAQKLH